MYISTTINVYNLTRSGISLHSAAIESLQVEMLIFSMGGVQRKFLEPLPFVACLTKDLPTKRAIVLS